jgi:hypothetical protein
MGEWVGRADPYGCHGGDLPLGENGSGEPTRTGAMWGICLQGRMGRASRPVRCAIWGIWPWNKLIFLLDFF